MANEVRHLPDPGVVEVRYVGVVTEADLAAGFAAGLALCQQHDVWHVLTDSRGISQAPTVVDLYGVVDALEATGHLHEYREALLPPPDPESAAGARFYGDACVNRGLRVQLFASREDALAWLASP